MHGAAGHHAACVANLPAINALFAGHGANVGKLLGALDALPGIGPTIASGLIYSVNRATLVPFDKHTMGYALELRLVRTNRITTGNNYAAASAAVVQHAARTGLNGIEGFVRIASQNVQFPFEPE